jgi:anthranilate phosphoribosyltransferase
MIAGAAATMGEGIIRAAAALDSGAAAAVLERLVRVSNEEPAA